MHDSTPSHTDKKIEEYLMKMGFKMGCLMEWPAFLPDLNSSKINGASSNNKFMSLDMSFLEVELWDTVSKMSFMKLCFCCYLIDLHNSIIQ